jgi:saccharopine dehydrogenase-like NADP-dependent oxidoreductase
MSSMGKVAVYGAAGHTGRFVVAELRRRGRSPILVGRDAAKLRAVAEAYPGSEARVAGVDAPAALDAAFAGAAAVIHCAGPFADTAPAVIEAALRAGAHYLDVAAEQGVAISLFERYRDPASTGRRVVAPSMAFYGGLGNLLATAALGDWPEADEIRIGIALDSWWPTLGTRATGRRNTGPRFLLANHQLEVNPAVGTVRSTWRFPSPIGSQEVVALPTADVITLSRHVRVPAIRVYMNLAPLADVLNPSTPPPAPADDRGRSAQTFLVEAVVRRGGEERRAAAHGRDIYAITAPIVVEAAERILDGRAAAAGARAAGELFDARDFLRALAPDPLAVSLD